MTTASGISAGQSIPGIKIPGYMLRQVTAIPMDRDRR